MKFSAVFKLPQPITIKGRTSSVTNAFVNGIIPCLQPTEDQIKDALKLLGMDENTICCAYCGDRYTEWDHFHPLIRDKQPTGYITEIDNLVPACGKCNQSKGNRHWRDWISGSAKLSPRTRGVEDIVERIKRLDIYEANTKPHIIDFAKCVENNLWKKHWQNYELMIKLMADSQVLSNKIRAQLNDSAK